MDDISQDNFLLSKEYENSLDVDTKKARDRKSVV